MTTYETGEIKVEPRYLGAHKIGVPHYYVAVFYNMPVHFNGAGKQPLDAIRDLLDAEEQRKGR